MPRHYRFGVPALLVTSVYVGAVAVAAVTAPAVGDLGVLWRLTLFREVDEGVAVTWPHVLVLVLAGLVWAWALWQSLRGPLAGPPSEPDRDVRRLRVALYAALAFWLFYFLLPWWPWWVTALDAAVMLVVVVRFQPVLGRDLEYADHMRGAGVLAYGGAAVAAVLDVLGRPIPGGVDLVCGLAGLVWMVLVLRAQWRDGRWRRATVLYGIASLVGAGSVGGIGAFAEEGNVYVNALTATQALLMIWLARSAHELADPRHRPAPPDPAPPDPERPDPERPDPGRLDPGWPADREDARGHG